MEELTPVEESIINQAECEVGYCSCEDTLIDDNTDPLAFILKSVQEEIDAVKLHLDRVDALIKTIAQMYDELEDEDHLIATVLDSYSCFELLTIAFNKLFAKRNELSN